MRTGSSQKQYQLIIGYLIYEQPIRLNMTFSITTVITGKQVVTIFCFKRFTIGKSSNNLFYFIKIISALLR